MFNQFGKQKTELWKVTLPKKVPLLILDEVWLSQFPKEYKTNKVIELEEKIVELLKENARIKEQESALTAAKKDHLSKILELTTEAYDNDNIQAKMQMEKSQNDIVKINGQLPELETKAAKLPEEIEKVNTELLEETVKICYQLMRESTARLETVEKKVETLREELRGVVAERAVLNENSQKTYHLLHNLIGPENIEALDINYDKRRRKKWF